MAASTTSRTLKMDAETRKKLLGMLPFSEDARSEFIPEFYKNRGLPDKFIPVFTIRPYRTEEKRKITEIINDPGKAMEEKFLQAARKVLVGWKRLYDAATGEEIEFEADEDGACKDELWRRLPTDVMTRILNHAMKISGLASIDQESLPS